MQTKTFYLSGAIADVWIACDDPGDNSVDYYYGGTRLVSWETPDHEVDRMAASLATSESSVKNQLINLALESGAVHGFEDRLPDGFLTSRVLGARCVIRPRSNECGLFLSDPAHPEFCPNITAIFQDIAAFLETQDGKIKLTPDYGRFAGLADLLHDYTPHVLGIQCDRGGCGGKSSYTVTGIVSVLDLMLGQRLAATPVTLIGAAGALGSGILEHLIVSDCSRIAISDLVYEDGKAVKGMFPKNVSLLPSEIGKFTKDCLTWGNLIIAATIGRELENSEWETIPPETILLLAHNLAMPPGEAGTHLARCMHERAVKVIPGQILTLGGALTSRVEWFWRQAYPGHLFDKALAHAVVRKIVQYLFVRIDEISRGTGLSPFESMYRLLEQSNSFLGEPTSQSRMSASHQH